MDEEAPISITFDGNAKQVMQASIKQKLSEITGSQVDDVLPEYVMVMVANHKSKGQVASDLEAFLPDQSQTFTTWLWDALHAMNSDTHSRKPADIKRQSRDDDDDDRSRGRDREREGRGRDTKREPSPSRSVFASVISVPPTAAERQRTTLDNPAPARLILSAVQEAVRSTSVPGPVRAVEITEREQERERDQQRGRDRDYGRDREYYSRDRGYNGRDRGDRDRRDRGDKSRDAVFDRLGSRDSEMEDLRRSREEKRPRSRETKQEYTISPSLSSRLGSAISTPASNTSSEAATNVYLPDTLGRVKKEGEEDPVTFTVTLNGVKEEETDPVSKPLRNKRRADETDDLEEEDVPMGGGGKKVKKEKCQFWPNCKRGDECAYFHPTQKCKLFPDCPFADKCLYIHPSVPCKFGAKCARPDCAYTHPAPSALSLSGSFQAPAFTPKGKLSVNSALPTGLGPNTSKFAPVPTHGAKPCKHGFACPQRSEGCTFFHPPNACVYGEQCARPGCTFAHGKTCRSGIACTTPGCTFVHAPIIKTPCKFGAGCLNNACRFQHDVPKAANDAAMADAEDTSAISASLPRTPPRVAAV